MHIEVITEGIWSRFGDAAPLFGAAHVLAAHDLEVVKPALLYGSTVSLRTGNLYARSQLSGQRARLTMPLQAVIGAARLCREESVRLHLTETLGVSDSDLLDREVCDEFVRRNQGFTEDDDFMPYILGWAQTAGASLDTSIRALHVAIANEADQLIHPDLSRASDAGILEIKPHTSDVPPEFDTVGDYLVSELPDSYLQRALTEIVGILNTSGTTCLLDPWAYSVATQSTSPDLDRGALAAELGMHLLSDLPTLRDASVAEVLDLREELRLPLTRFRAATIDAADEFAEGPDEREIAAFIAEYRTRTIEPSLAEIEEAVRENSYVGELLRVPMKPTDAATVGGWLAFAAASGTSQTQLLAAAIGLGLPAARAWQEQRKNERAVEKNKFFLLYALEDPRR